MRFGRALSRLSLLVTPVVLLTTALAPVTAARATAAPSATIVTPTQGSTVTGLTSVKVRVTTDGSTSDLPGAMVLYVDGKVGGGANSCFPESHDCTFFFLFDWSGYTGNHTEQVKGRTADGVAVSSPLVTVKAVSPVPHAGITSPSEGDVVTAGEVPVTTVGIIDPSQDEEFPGSVELFADGTSVAFSYCMLRPLCDVPLTWDASAVPPGPHTLRVTYTTSLGRTALSPVVHVTVAAPPVLAAPTVHIDSPTDGTSVTGLHAAHVTATTDPDSSDRPASTRLYLDGVLDSTAVCGGSASTCTWDHLYDVSGLTGSHLLQATMTTQDGVTVSSQTVTITAVSPPPTVAVTSPAAGATVTGAHVEVDASGTIDPQQTFDFPQSLALAVDGVTVATHACGTGSETACSAGLDWDTSAAAPGPHSLVVSLTTSHGRVGNSPAVVVLLAAVQQQPVQTALTLTGAATTQRGATGTVRGLVTQVATGSGLPGVPVTVTFTSPTGAQVTVTVTSDLNGHFVAADPVPLVGNTAVLASVGPAFGSASATQTLPVGVHITCSVPAKAVHGAHVVVTCSVPGLAYRSVVTLHYAGRAGHGTVIGRVSRGTVSFTFVAPRAQRLRVWATTAATRSFVASTSRVAWLRVR